jgi:thymidylate synthase
MLKTMTVRNVCEALPRGLALIQEFGRRERSRAGDVLVLPGPVLTETTKPTERVLFSPIRDANPFFHICEAMWMLAGQQDARPLDTFVSNFSSQFAEQGGVMHGAYGFRWRRHFMFDQLSQIVDMLRNDPTTRQAVLAMWDPHELTVPVDRGSGDVGEDLIGGADLTGAWKDRPCNTHAYFRVRFEHETEDGQTVWEKYLDLTVCCRSNDLIWGAHGANAVHFSVLQEYVAARVGCRVGTMVQLSNNYHAYAAFLDVLKKRADATGKNFAMSVMLTYNRYQPDTFGETDAMVAPEPMFTAPDAIDDDVGQFWRWFTELNAESVSPQYKNEWFATTLEMMVMAHYFHRKGAREEALHCAREVDSRDWSAAAVEWLQRRNSEKARTGATDDAAVA